MKTKYFTLPLIYLYSLMIAAIDSFMGNLSAEDPFDFETFCMRALIVFTYWLIIRLVAERAELQGRSYKKYMFLTAALIPTLIAGFAFALPFLK